MEKTPVILVVEDNELNRDLLKRRLEKRGYKILIAEDGDQGVDVCTTQKPDLILMDVNMPVMDGLEATRRIKSNAETKHIPIIVVTAHTTDKEKEETMKSGCNDFEAKPVEFERLMGKIKVLLAQA